MAKEYIQWDTIVKDAKRKIFKDLFGRTIKVGDTVLKVWANDMNFYERGQGSEGSIQYRIAKVVRFCPKSIRIEYNENSYKRHKLNKNGLFDCSVYNTRNRIIILEKNNRIVDISNFEKSTLAHIIKPDNLNKDLAKAQNSLTKKNEDLTSIKWELEQAYSKKNEMKSEIKELKQTIEELMSNYTRFEMLDL